VRLDSQVYEIDEDHIEGTGDILFKGMMRAAAERAECDPGYNPPRLSSATGRRD